MRKPASMQALEELGRVRLSTHIFMRDMLYSEIANFHGIPDIPDDPDRTIEGGLHSRLAREAGRPYPKPCPTQQGNSHRAVQGQPFRRPFLGGSRIPDAAVLVR